jgi:hypothetical protein
MSDGQVYAPLTGGASLFRRFSSLSVSVTLNWRVDEHPRYQSVSSSQAIAVAGSEISQIGGSSIASGDSGRGQFFQTVQNSVTPPRGNSMDESKGAVYIPTACFIACTDSLGLCGAADVQVPSFSSLLSPKSGFGGPAGSSGGKDNVFTATKQRMRAADLLATMQPTLVSSAHDSCNGDHDHNHDHVSQGKKGHGNMKSHGHGHSHSHGGADAHSHGDDDDSCMEEGLLRSKEVKQASENAWARRKLLLAGGLCFLFMIGEFVGGFLAHSLAIMTEYVHWERGSLAVQPVCRVMLRWHCVGFAVPPICCPIWRAF